MTRSTEDWANDVIDTALVLARHDELNIKRFRTICFVDTEWVPRQAKIDLAKKLIQLTETNKDKPLYQVINKLSLEVLIDLTDNF
jgi:hypothetical protein